MINMLEDRQAEEGNNFLIFLRQLGKSIRLNVQGLRLSAIECHTAWFSWITFYFETNIKHKENSARC